MEFNARWISAKLLKINNGKKIEFSELIDSSVKLKIFHQSGIMLISQWETPFEASKHDIPITDPMSCHWITNEEAMKISE